MNKHILTLTFCLMISSCALNGYRNATEFKERWNQSTESSVVSWWYMGETDKYYFLKEKWIFISYQYEIPKGDINLNINRKMSPCDICEGINIKTSNVKFNQ